MRTLLSQTERNVLTFFMNTNGYYWHMKTADTEKVLQKQKNNANDLNLMTKMS